MTRYLLDTNHASVFRRKRELVAEKLRSLTDARIGLCLPSVGEIWYMVFNSGRPDDNAAELSVFLRDYEYWHYDADAALEFGRIKAELRKAGRPIPDADAQIAAIARTNHLVPLTADKHFDSVSGLVSETWVPPT